MSDLTAQAIIAHQSRGRTRLRFRNERGNARFFETLVRRLSAIPGISHVEVRPQTGSVLLLHQGSWMERAEQVLATGLFTLMEEEAAGSSLDGATIPPGLSPQAIVSGLMAALAALQVARGEILPPAVTLLHYADQLAGGVLNRLKKEQ